MKFNFTGRFYFAMEYGKLSKTKYLSCLGADLFYLQNYIEIIEIFEINFTLPAQLHTYTSNIWLFLDCCSVTRIRKSIMVMWYIM